MNTNSTTKYLNPENNNNMIEAINLIKNGNIVAFPTETVYGLGGNAFSDSAISKIFEVKGRPSDNPLIVHVASIQHCENIIGRQISGKELALAKSFWPGPLSIIFEDYKMNDKNKAFSLSSKVTCGLKTAAFRIPANPVALKLISGCNLPIAAPSANISGRVSPTKAEHVFDDFNGKIPLILNGGDCKIGLESTVIMVNKNNSAVKILRLGGITKEMIENVLGPNSVEDDFQHKKLENAPVCPGLKYKHYAPLTKLIILKNNYENFKNLILDQFKINPALKNSKSIGILCSDELKIFLTKNLPNLENFEIIALGPRKNLDEIASKIFSSLRKMDKLDLKVIFSEYFSEEGIGSALMNRLKKASEIIS